MDLSRLISPVPQTALAAEPGTRPDIASLMTTIPTGHPNMFLSQLDGDKKPKKRRKKFPGADGGEESTEDEEVAAA